jgi:isoleucyl-tRNA synthetase
MTRRKFPPLPGGYPFPKLELEVLESWRQQRIFERSVDRPAPRGNWVLFDGPPTANNVPHIGHVLTRVVKDLFPRFRTMQGFRVERKAGWDTHGLPVEIEVEKRLGFSGKEQIEKYGIAEFNAACLESVHTYERQWRAMTERVGYWTDMDHPYFTYTNDYIESVWWSLSELWRKELLYRGHKIQPYCARCGTTLSSHEVAQNYKDTEDPSVWILFPARAGQSLATVDGSPFEAGPNLSLVAWTTTPWTLIAHVALAVHPDLIYRVIADPGQDGRQLLIGEGLGTPVPRVVEDDDGRRQVDLRDAPTLARIAGSALLGLRYQRPFTFFPAPGGVAEGDAPWRVVAGDYVTASDGTGLVHTAPPFGEDDYRTGQKNELPFFLSVDGEGKITEEAGAFAGMWFKDADPAITRDLKERQRLLHSARYQHNYPFCWRCDTALLYYATESWFVRTTAAKDRLVELNREIDWHPAHVGDGRFGNWLENVVDWALSRSRYWGTPLPVWECTDCDHTEVPGSYARLFELAGKQAPENVYDREHFDPHRPFIDDFTWPCGACGKGSMVRVPEVIDAWFDSGAMPFAQHHYPFAEGGEFQQQFPANLISEAVDQTRGWFYTLHVLGTLLFDSVAFERCVVLGHINDEQGRKMSKRLGNVVEPMSVVADAGADALRWYFYISNPEQPSRFSSGLVREAAQKFQLPLWNALSFFSIYANLDGWRPGASASVPFAQRPALDRWMLLRLDRLVRETTQGLEDLAIGDCARRLEGFVDDLTNWYIRRSRDRFWAPTTDAEEGHIGEESRDKESAYQTLYEVLTTLSRLLAPFTPFLADFFYRHLEGSQSDEVADSVHLEPWPVVTGDRAEPELEASMAAVQRIVRLGHAARNSHALKTRQPLASVTLVSADPALPALIAPHIPLLEEELNVRAIHWAEDRSAYVHHEIRPIFPKLGPRFGKRMPQLKRALIGADGDALAAELEATGEIRLTLEGETIVLQREEVEVRLEEREGMATQGDSELLVALDTDLTPELVSEGWAREVVNRIQTARKEADLDYADHIVVRYRADEDLETTIETWREWICGETLTDRLVAIEDAGEDADTAPLVDSNVDGHAFAYTLSRVD